MMPERLPSPLDRIDSVSLATLLQMLAMERVTCAIEVEAEDCQGKLYLEAGELVHATTGDREGIEAARSLVELHDATFRLVRGARPGEHSIDQPLMRILLSLAHERDEIGQSERSSEADRSRSTADPASPFEALSVEELLADLAEQLPELIATDLVHIESGLSIAGVSRPNPFDPALAAASAAEIVRANRRAVRLLGLDEHTTEDVLITGSDFQLLIRMIGPSYCQVLAVTPRCNLGLARAWQQSFQPRLREALARRGS